MKISQSEKARTACFVTAATSLGLSALLLGLHRYRPTRFPYKQRAYAFLAVGVGVGLYGLASRSTKDSPGKPVNQHFRKFLQDICGTEGAVDEILSKTASCEPAHTVAQWDQLIDQLNLELESGLVGFQLVSYDLWGSGDRIPVRLVTSKDRSVTIGTTPGQSWSPAAKQTLLAILKQLSPDPQSISPESNWLQDSASVFLRVGKGPFQKLSSLWLESIRSS